MYEHDRLRETVLTMNPKPKSKLAAALVGGTLIVGGGGVLATTLPSNERSTTVSARITAQPITMPTPALSLPPAAPLPVAARTKPSRSAQAVVKRTKAAKRTTRPARKRAAKARSITYTVKRGDTLSGIADWFKFHGYGALYAANRAVVGANPNLIFPGQRITITRRGAMTFKRSTPAAA